MTVLSTLANDAPRPRSRPRSRRWLLAPAAGLVAFVVLASGCVMNGTWAATAPIQDVGPSRFTDVSCVSDDWCIAAGFGDASSKVQTWNGTSWTSFVAPTLPGGTTFVLSVDCLAVERCVAVVGHDRDEPGPFEYAMYLDGNVWSQVPGSVNPLDLGPYPYGMSCVPGTCVFADYANDGMKVWDGSSWQAVPSSSFGPVGFLIECVSSTDCISTTDETGSYSRWDGTDWTDVLVDSDLSVQSIQCPASTDHCLGFGYDSSTAQAVAAVFDGTDWTTEPLPVAAPVLGGLSCASSGECVGVAVNGSTTTQLAWNGQDWFAAPASPVAGTTTASCVPLWCMKVGRSAGSPAQRVAATYTWTSP